MNESQADSLARTLATLERNYLGGHITLEGYENLKAEAIKDSRQDLKARGRALAKSLERNKRINPHIAKRNRGTVATKKHRHVITPHEAEKFRRLFNSYKAAFLNVLNLTMRIAH